MAQQQFEGRTAAEAAIKACEELDVSRSRLKYDIVSDEGEGLDRKVVIVVDTDANPPDEPPRRDEVSSESASAPERDDEPRRGRGGRGGRGGGRGGRGRRGDREGGRGRRRRGGRGDRGDRRPRRDRDEGDGFESLLNLDAMPAELPPARPEVEGEPTPKAQMGKEVVGKLLDLMEVSVAPTLVQDDDSEVHLDLRGDDAVKVIGDKGEVLLSLQFILNRIVTRNSPEESTDRVVVLDAAGYRERRRDALKNLATRLAERATEENKVVRLSPMSAHDRRVFHLTLRDIEGVDTRSEGDGLYRNLLIIPSQFVD